MTFRPVVATSQSQPAIEGAGVHLRRVFGFDDPSLTDPFLMMDDFRNDDPRMYAKGFPWHPHRGIETITYVLEGEVEHADSLGNKGLLSAGSLQWMTAGSASCIRKCRRATHRGECTVFSYGRTCREI